MGALGLYREPDQALFDRDEIAFVRAVSALLAEGARRALLAGEAIDPEESESPGLVVLASGCRSGRPFRAWSAGPPICPAPVSSP